MKITATILLLSATLAAHSQAYLEETFSTGIPSRFKVENVDNAPMKDGIYANMGTKTGAAWVAGTLNPGYGRAALSPTRCADDEIQQENRMILPVVTIADGDAIVRWDARSLHGHIAESYKVEARENGAPEWTTLYTQDAENYAFTTRCASLAAFEGKDIEICFTATTRQGFILAVDNIFVGVPTDHKFTFTSTAPHYAGVNENNSIGGTLTFFGHESPWTALRLSGAGEEQTIELPVLAAGESFEARFDVSPSVGDHYNYTLTAIDGEGHETEIYSDFMTCSHFPRTHVIDHGTGTWCNNCPLIEVPLRQLMGKYGDEIIITEIHMGANDVLTNKKFNDDFFSNYVFAVPALVPNHDDTKVSYQLNINDDYSTVLEPETISFITVGATYGENGEVNINSTTRMAMNTDNTGDRYRVAYLLTGDYHDPQMRAYRQRISAMGAAVSEYYYHPDPIQAEMMYYDNVPVDASVAYNGVPSSLPSAISAGTDYNHTFSLSKDGFTGNKLSVLAMVIDTDSHKVMNAAITDVKDPTGIEMTVTDEGCDAPVILYDIAGRRINSENAKGFYIERQGNSSRKTIKK